jgi:hypothetical protein
VVDEDDPDDRATSEPPVDPDLRDVVPTPFARHVPKRSGREEARKLEPFDFGALRGRRVVVRANGYVYRGVLSGVGDGELYLKGDLRWFVLALEDVASVIEE